MNLLASGERARRTGLVYPPSRSVWSAPSFRTNGVNEDAHLASSACLRLSVPVGAALGAGTGLCIGASDRMGDVETGAGDNEELKIDVEKEASLLLAMASNLPLWDGVKA